MIDVLNIHFQQYKLQLLSIKPRKSKSHSHKHEQNISQMQTNHKSYTHKVIILKKHYYTNPHEDYFR